MFLKNCSDAKCVIHAYRGVPKYPFSVEMETMIGSLAMAKYFYEGKVPAVYPEQCLIVIPDEPNTTFILDLQNGDNYDGLRKFFIRKLLIPVPLAEDPVVLEQNWRSNETYSYCETKKYWKMLVDLFEQMERGSLPPRSQ